MPQEYLPIAYTAFLAISLVMVLAAWKRPTLGRVLLALLFAWAAPTNLHAILTQPGLYLDYAPDAYPEFYRDFIRGPFSRQIVAIVGAIAAGQVAIAVLVLLSGWLLRLGLLGAIVFLVAIAPLGAGAAFPATLLMAVAAGFLLYHDRRAPQPSLVRSMLEALGRVR